MPTSKLYVAGLLPRNRVADHIQRSFIRFNFMGSIPAGISFLRISSSPFRISSMRVQQFSFADRSMSHLPSGQLSRPGSKVHRTDRRDIAIPSEIE